MNKQEFGIRLQETRNSAGYTQEELAELLDISSSFITAMERGVKQPSVETLIKLAETLNVSSDWLLGVKKKRGRIAELQYFDEELKGLPVRTQKRIVAYMKLMIDYEIQMENE